MFASILVRKMNENIYRASEKLINARKLQPAQTAIHRQHKTQSISQSHSQSESHSI